MDSPGLINRPIGSRWIPLAAIVQDDLRQTVRHWAFLTWLALSVLTPLYWVANLSAPKAPTNALTSLIAPDGVIRHVVAKPQQDGDYVRYEDDLNAQAEAAAIAERHRHGASGSNYDSQPTQVRKPFRYVAPLSGSNSVTQLGGRLLALQLLFMVALATVVGAAAVANDLPIVGDAILCWGVARWQYIVGKLAARLLAVFGLMFAVGLASLWLFASRTTADAQFYASLGALMACGLVLASAATVGVCAGVWFRSPIRATVAALAVVMGVGVLAAMIGSADYSPTVMAGYFPYALAGDPDGVHSRLPIAAAGFSAIVAAATTVKFLWADL